MIDIQTRSLLSSLGEIKNRRLKDIQAREYELDRNLIIVESFKSYCDELSSKGSASDICRNKDQILFREDELEEDHELYILRQPVSYDFTFLATDLNGNIIGTLEGNAHYFTINVLFALHKSCVLQWTYHEIITQGMMLDFGMHCI